MSSVESQYKWTPPSISLGYERIRQNPDMMSAFQRFIAGDPRKQWIIKYANLPRSDFLTICDFTENDWFEYNAAKEFEYDCNKPDGKGGWVNLDEKTILTDAQFQSWVKPTGKLTYRLYLDMNLLTPDNNPQKVKTPQ